MSKSSLTSLSRTLCQRLLPTHKPFSSLYYSTGTEYTSELDELPLLNSEQPTESPPIGDSPELGPELSSSSSSSSAPQFGGQRAVSHNILEGGLDIGIYKALIVGQVGQSPLQKRLKNGKMMTLTTIGTGGIRNERIPFPNEEPREYADRCTVQWHRVAVYPERLGDLIMKHAQPGALLYLEGNLETKIFTDPITGLVRRIREIAVRRNGRVVFLGNGGNFDQPSVNEMKGVGYF